MRAYERLLMSSEVHAKWKNSSRSASCAAAAPPPPLRVASSFK